MHASCPSAHVCRHPRQLRIAPAVSLCVILATSLFIASFRLELSCKAIRMLARSLSSPPVAERREHTVPTGFDPQENVSDPYYWLRDDSRVNKEVLQYLKAENQYAEQYFEQLDPLVHSIIDEIDARTPRVEISQPNYNNGHIYYRERAPGDDYWTQYRLPVQSSFQHSNSENNIQQVNLAQAVAAATEAALNYPPIASNTLKQVVLNENSLSSGHQYWDIYGAEVSSDGTRIAVPYDTVGSECYQLQVYNILSGSALLRLPRSGCSGDVVWWGNSNTVLVSTEQDQVLKSDSAVTVRLLNLPQQQLSSSDPYSQQQQQQHPPPSSQPAVEQQQQQQEEVESAVLYRSQEGETGLSLKVTHDQRYLILTSNYQDGTWARALPTNTPLNFTSSSSSSSSDSDLAVQGSAWLDLITPSDDLDVLQIDHIGHNLGQVNSSNSSSSSADLAAAAAAGSSSSGMFAAIIDSDDAPDGELVVLHRRGDNSSKQTMDVLISSRNCRQSSSPHNSSSSSNSTNSDMNSVGNTVSGSSNDNQQHHPGSSTAAAVSPGNSQQQQQQQQRQQHIEIDKFVAHAASDHLAVAIRRSGICAINLYKLNGHQAPAAAAAATVPVISLTLSSSSSSKSQHKQYVPDPAPNDTRASASSSSSSAALIWILVADDQTLVLDLEGIEGSAADPWLVVQASGLTTPTTTVYINLHTKQQMKVYQESVPTYEASQYVSKLEWAISADGTAVPVTLAYKNSLMQKDGSNKAVLHGYGAYGSKQWPKFNPADTVLLDRGFVLAVAHVRGGGELGSDWHTDGKKFDKKHTFEDFLAVSQHLVAQLYTSPERLAYWGRSAGGLTVAAALNMNPGSAAVAILDVPFVDILNTMRDPELPLTIKERSEWGDPLDSKEAFEYIRSYSPYNNINPNRTYPAMYLTASLHDTRVNYWEPAKYVAAMRHDRARQTQQRRQQVLRQDAVPAQRGQPTQQLDGGGVVDQQRPLLLLTDMDAGHFAASSASRRLQDRARKVAFILRNLECS